MHWKIPKVYTIFAHDKDHILKFRTLALFLIHNF